ncbi:hypothetical protein V8G54_033060 [Vigna mungo]|uniref:Uncharacterized protein n=1 Tax=Vigna mungo TaxID=3915 RepID=A0AAQ3RII0_VIGMU
MVAELATSAWRVRAVTSEDEWGTEKEEAYGGGVAVEEKVAVEPETENLKKALVGSFYGTNRGLKATSETRAEIVYILCRFISVVVKWNTSVGEGRGNISDYRLAKFHCPKLCSVRWSFGHHLN